MVIRRIVPAVTAFLACTLPALAQSTSTEAAPTLLPVWGWIIVAGFVIFGVGTSLGASKRR